MIALETSYPGSEEGTVSVYDDVRIPDVADRLRSERAAWGECRDIESLDKGYFILIIRSGRARSLAA